MAKYAIMPAEDYLDACNATREKTGGTDPIKSGELGSQIRSISGGDTSVEDALITRTLTQYANDRVTSIGDCAFYQIAGLTEVDFPLVKNIGENAFFGCTGLTSVNIPLARRIGYASFRNCTSLSAARFPAVTFLANYAFYSCSALTAINFPILYDISAEAFNGCTSLVVADFPLVSQINSFAFYGCENLLAICLRNTSDVCIIYDPTVFRNTPIANGTGYIYVPRALIESYKVAENWSTYAAQFRALEDYTVDGTVTGELDMSKI